MKQVIQLLTRPLVLTTMAILALFALALTAPGQESQRPGSTFFSEFQALENQVGDRMMALARAIPAERYTWRPSEEVRSVSEVLMHIAALNLGSAQAVGATLPPDLPSDLSQVSAKPEVLTVLETSYRLSRGAAKALAGADPSQPMPGGNGMTLRAAMLGFVEHQGEHLGQLIAYARGLGVVPPWSR